MPALGFLPRIRLWTRLVEAGMTQELPGSDPLPEPQEPSRFGFLAQRRIGLSLTGLLLLGTLGFFGLRALGAKPEKPEQGKGRGQQVAAVTVGTVTQKTVPIQLQAIGNVQAENTVSVTPQIGGQITGVFFKKGQQVQKGQLLFTLDDRTALAAIQQARGTLARDQAAVQQARATMAKDQGLVQQARATLAKDQAQAQFAQAQDRRYRDLYGQGAVSQDQAQQYAANNQAYAATLQADQQAIANAEAVVKGDEAAIANAEAVVSADQGAVQNAEVQLSYTKIYAPISGQAGDILVNQGNVVQANGSSALVKISQIRPIQVSFAVPESNLPAIQRYMRDGKLTVDVTFPNSNSRPARGVLSFVNNAVDPTTGTIQLMGEFDNDLGNLWPGQYVNATLTLTTEPNATVVPTQAVQNGPKGQFVFVVKPDMTVASVPVAVNTTVSGLAVVQNGLQPGDKVVTDGQANLVAGSKVRVKDGNAPAATGDNSQQQPRGRRRANGGGN